MEVLEPSVSFCVGNRDGSPVILPQGVAFTAFVLAAGQSTTVPKGTKLYVCSGSLNVAGKVIPEFRQLQFTDDRQVTAINTVYGIIFP